MNYAIKVIPIRLMRKRVLGKQTDLCLREIDSEVRGVSVLSAWAVQL